MNPIVIDPPGFDQAAAWNECREYVDKCGGLQHEGGEVNWRAAFGADPGCCSCPACGEMYWAWGRRQRCVKCAFEYPTDWWSMYSWGAQAGWRKTQGYQPIAFNFDRYMKHPYYRYGFEHPVEDPWKETKTEAWRAAIRIAMSRKEAGCGE